MKNIPIHYCNLLIVVLIALNLSACKSSTKPSSQNISGRIVLVNDTGDSAFDPIDFSMTSVALYKLSDIDSSVVRLNHEYPQLGVIQNQVTEFDHRFHAPIAVCNTDAHGAFSFNNIPRGIYHLVACKDTWGTRYYHNVNLQNSDIDLGVIFELYPLTFPPSHINSAFTFKENHSYLFSSNSTITTDVSIHGGAQILVAPGAKLEFINSSIQVNSNAYWRISSSDSFSSFEKQEQIAPFTTVKIQGSINPIELKNLVFDRSTDGLYISAPSASVSNSIFRHNSSYALNMFSTSGLVKNCIFIKNPMNGLESRNEINVVNSLFIDNKDACRIFESQGQVKNNYFLLNSLALRPFLSDIEIINNSFDDNHVALPICAANPIVKYNSFYKNKLDLETNNYYVHQSIAYCNPAVQHNNFFFSNIYVKLKGTNSLYGSSPPGVNQDQHYPLNYWSIPDPYIRIMDGNYPDAHFNFIVNISPRTMGKINAAGIQ